MQIAPDPSATRRSVRRRALFVAVAFGLVCGCGRGVRNPEATHVVLVSIDCLNARQLAEGFRDGYTPALAGLAADSMEFTRAYTQAPWTTPAHVSLLSGLYPHQHGHTEPYRSMLANDSDSGIVPEYPVLAETLAAAGYETAAFVGQGPISARYGTGRGFGRFEESAKNADESDLGRTLERLRDWLDEGGDAPFFVFVHTFDFHDPRPPARREVREALAYVDRRIGDLVALLKERGLYSKSLIVLTGDHGSEMIRTAGKCCIHGAGHYEENLHVPLLVKLPGAELVGSFDSLARHVDVFSTVADVLGIGIEGYHGPGVSLVDVARDEATTPYSFSEADARCATRLALVSQHYKYIFTPHGPVQERLWASPGFRDKYCVGVCSELPRREEFFDLRSDPFEQRDLLLGALDPEQAAALQRHRAAMAGHRALAAQFERRGGGAPQPPDPELQESLRRLGYLE